MVVLCQGVSPFLKQVSHAPSVSEERHLIVQDVTGPGCSSMEAPVSLLAMGRGCSCRHQRCQDTPSLAPALGWAGWFTNVVQEIGSVKA